MLFVCRTLDKANGLGLSPSLARVVVLFSDLDKALYLVLHCMISPRKNKKESS